MGLGLGLGRYLSLPDSTLVACLRMYARSGAL